MVIFLRGGCASAERSMRMMGKPSWSNSSVLSPASGGRREPESSVDLEHNQDTWAVKGAYMLRSCQAYEFITRPCSSAGEENRFAYEHHIWWSGT